MKRRVLLWTLVVGAGLCLPVAPASASAQWGAAWSQAGQGQRGEFMLLAANADEERRRREAQQRAEQERAAQQRAAQQRAEQERAAQQRAEQERAAQQRAAQQRAEQERAERERAMQQRATHPPQPPHQSAPPKPPQTTTQHPPQVGHPPQPPQQSAPPKPPQTTVQHPPQVGHPPQPPHQSAPPKPPQTTTQHPPQVGHPPQPPHQSAPPKPPQTTVQHPPQSGHPPQQPQHTPPQVLGQPPRHDPGNSGPRPPLAGFTPGPPPQPRRSPSLAPSRVLRWGALAMIPLAPLALGDARGRAARERARPPSQDDLDRWLGAGMPAPPPGFQILVVPDEEDYQALEDAYAEEPALAPPPAEQFAAPPAPPWPDSAKTDLVIPPPPRTQAPVVLPPAYYVPSPPPAEVVSLPPPPPPAPPQWRLSERSPLGGESSAPQIGAPFGPEAGLLAFYNQFVVGRRFPPADEQAAISPLDGRWRLLLVFGPGLVCHLSGLGQVQEASLLTEAAPAVENLRRIHAALSSAGQAIAPPSLETRLALTIVMDEPPPVWGVLILPRDYPDSAQVARAALLPTRLAHLLAPLGAKASRLRAELDTLPPGPRRDSLMKAWRVALEAALESQALGRDPEARAQATTMEQVRSWCALRSAPLQGREAQRTVDEQWLASWIQALR